jgi:tRNA (guanosine-2'-O-)-methyltransferase
VATALLLFEAYRQREEAGLYRRSRLTEADHRRLLFEWAYPEIARVLAGRGEPYPPLTPEGEIVE